ncbi:exocyst complex component Sec10-domain-containing protein [Tribonema minus]|uniref:Exocyst complex component Sec10-domain-containing protein n=1 Tax=Tribonema minus TaxID=303371 RepID=A0A836C795_9STRA|nr:exocyst complex component Sec10-domain-containing protein [Tribonema minus]
MVGHLVIPALRAASQLLPNPVTASSATLKDILGDAPPPLPPRQLYEVVAACTGASRALQEHHRDVVSTGMEGTPTVRTIALETRRSHVQQVEGAAGRVLQKALEMVAAGTERILANRKAKDDYALRDDSAAAMDASRTVKALCALLQDQYALATHCLPGTDMTALWQAVGLCALTLFCDHLKRARVTVAGAFVLANDVNALRRALGAVGAPRVDAALEDLREVANLFLVPPANLGALMETGRLAAMPRGDLLAYVRQRADYAPAGPGGGARAAWARELFGADDAAAALPPEAREIKLGGFKERFAAELGSFAVAQPAEHRANKNHTYKSGSESALPPLRSRAASNALTHAKRSSVRSPSAATPRSSRDGGGSGGGGGGVALCARKAALRRRRRA